MDRTVADPMIGRVLDGRYRVGPRIARGGMATVYEATDLRLDRVCALKIMHTGLGDDDDFAGRFVREARSAARLSHPNVVSVFDQGDDDGALFLAMEYVPGHTLRDLVRAEAPLSPARALALLDPVLAALAAAHQAGIVHRDVKPENVLIADDGRVKVADFGLARAVSAETQHTATGAVLIGTVSYLSPELVVEGRSDARSDVYAVGVLLYEMLTGHKPHEGDSPITVAWKHVHEDVPPPSRDVSGIPPYVDALVARATARDPQLRPADARVLQHQVRRVRAALDHGVVDDPDLTADLTPTVTVPGLDSIDYVVEDAPRIVDPSRVGDEPDSEHTSVIGAAAARRQAAGPGPRRPRRGRMLLVLVLLLAVLAGGWWFGIGRYTTTPAVVDLTSSQARTRVAAAGLGFDIANQRFSETVPPGSVVSTDPSAGSRVLKDGTVHAVVSKGPERYPVPALRGMTLDEARRALRGDHLLVGSTTRRYDEQVAVGVVLASEPGPRAEVRRNTSVDLVLSKGPRPVRITDWTGRDADQARRSLVRQGFKVSSHRQHDDTVPKGQVIAQTPDTGKGFRGDRIRLVVSQGPVLVPVPKVTGMGIGDATSTLQAAGFEVATSHSRLYVGLGFVVKQSPGSGDRAPKGSTVTLSLV